MAQRPDFEEEYEYLLGVLYERHPRPIVAPHLLPAPVDRLVFAVDTGTRLENVAVGEPELRRMSQGVIDACYVIVAGRSTTCRDIVELLEPFASEAAIDAAEE